MTHISDEQLALYVGGDLTGEEADIVEKHLHDCVGCRTLFTEFQDMQGSLLASLGEPAENELQGVRHRVIQKLRKQKQATERSIWITAAAAAIIVAGLFVHQKQPRRAIHSDTVTAAYLPAPYRPIVQILIPNLAANIEPVHVRPHRRVPGLRTVTLLAENNGPPILKMTTSDPDVVILWQLNERTRHQ